MILALSCAACGGGIDSPKTPEDLSRAAFAALKADDADAFVRLAATRDDVEDLGDRMAAHLREAERVIEKRREKQGGSKGKVEKIRKRMRDSFIKARAKCEGILRLEDAEWAGFYRRSEEYVYGVRRKDFYFRVRQGGKLWRFKLDDCVFLNGRWVMLDGLCFFGED